MTPYIGITGFTSPEEVADVVRSLPPSLERLLMCGVLLSNALLDGGTSDAPGRCPSPGSISGIFSNDSRCLNLVHYRPRAEANLTDVLARAMAIGGPNCHGVQINATRGAPWPDPLALQEFRDRCQPRRIVLQVGGEAMKAADSRPDEIARRCAPYEGIVTDVLVDASEGMGVPLDAQRTIHYLTPIAEAAPSIGLVVAGGLCADNLDALLSPLLPEWAEVSIDAEGRLRDSDDRLDVGAASAYLIEALRLLDPVG
jgi:hypothetical protein